MRLTKELRNALKVAGFDINTKLRKQIKQIPQGLSFSKVIFLLSAEQQDACFVDTQGQFLFAPNVPDSELEE